MRTDNPSFTGGNLANSSSPRYVVEISFNETNTDQLYLTSHADTLTPAGGTVIPSCIVGVSGTSQQLAPERSISSIGSIKVEALDQADGLSTFIRGRLDNGFGLRGMRLRVYMGFSTQGTFNNYVLLQTQIIDTVEVKDGLYTFKTSDIQRSMRKDIFQLAETALSQNVTATDTTINVFDTTGFETKTHGTAYTDAPGQTVGYLYLENDDDDYEIIRYTGKTGTSFTGCTRGVLGTEPLTFNSSGTKDDSIQVAEYVYLELPLVQLIYAILTGEVFGEGTSLPDSWHLGISTDFVSTPEFQQIGEDLWDPTDATQGLVVRFVGLQEQDGKQFIEEQLLRLAGLYMPVKSDGQLYLKRMTGVLSDAGVVDTLNPSRIIQHSNLKHDMRDVRNRIAIRWNWSQTFEEYTRRNVLVDADSIATHGEAPLYEMEFRGLHGSRHSGDLIKTLFDVQRDRFAGPPLRMTVDCLPSANTLEVGDIVKVVLPNVQDYSGTGSLSRAFEIQQRRVDWVTGRVTLVLFGSSQAAGALPISEQGTPLPDSYYTSEGTDIQSFPGVQESGGVITITSDISLTGGTNINDAGSIYYADGDLTIANGVTVTISDNVQIRASGFVTVNGTIDGKGRGRVGATGQNDYSTIPAGEQGYAGGVLPPLAVLEVGLSTHRSGGGPRKVVNHGCVLRTPERFNENFSTPEAIAAFGEYDLLPVGSDVISSPANQSSPLLNLTVESGSLVGLPNDLRGSSGSAGYPLISKRSFLLEQSAGIFSSVGGTGGNGGAGLVIVSRGLGWGVNGKVDVSAGVVPTPPSYTPPNNGGNDPVLSSDYPTPFTLSETLTYYSGFGGSGSAGAFYIILDGTGNTVPVLTDRVVANIGEYDVPAADIELETMYYYEVTDPALAPNAQNYNGQSVIGTRDIPDTPIDMSRSMGRAQVLAGEFTAVPDLDYIPPAPASMTLSEIINLPRSVDGNLSTVNVQITPPADANFAYAIIEYRKKPATNADLDLATWTRALSGNTEGSFYAEADGSTYQVRARTVGLNMQESASALLDEITLSDATGTPAGTLTVPNVTGLALSGVAGTDYDGHDIAIEWNQDTATDGGDGVASYFSHFKVEVRTSGGTLLRTESTLTPSYIYTLEKNKIDNAGTPQRTIRFDVTQVSRQGVESPTAATNTFTNPTPAVVTGVTATAGLTGVSFRYTRPADNDFAGVQIHMSETPGFTSDAGTLVYEGSDNPAVVEGLTTETTFYFRITSVDLFGAGAQTGELTFASGAVAIAYADVTGTPTSLGDINATEGTKLTNIEDEATKGAPAGTFVNGVAVETVTTAVTNFNSNNDRDNTAVTDPTVAGDGTAIDHTIQTNGSANISFEWSFSGSENDIDGFIVYVRAGASATSYTFGTVPAEETAYVLPANKRAFFTYGVVPNYYYTFGVQAYRVVDSDIAASGVLKSNIVKSALGAENPYQPSTTVAFAGDLTGTINGGAVNANEVNVWTNISGTGKPADDATKNVIFRQTAAPSFANSGDLWYDTDDNLLYRSSGASWELVGNGYDNTNQLTDGASLGDTAIWSSVTGTGRPDDNADVTSDEINNTGVNITVNGGSLYSGKTTFASTSAGWWIGRDAGTGKLHFGNATKSFKWDGTNLEIVGGLKTATGTGQRFEVTDADNEAHFYADRGDGTVEELATIGISAVGADNVIGLFGTANSSRVAGYFRGNKSGEVLSVVNASSSSAARALYAISASGFGVTGLTSSGFGVYGQTGGGGGYGVYAENTSTSSGAPLVVVASISAAVPSHTAAKGSLWVTSGGVLYINTNGSTTWQKVGAQ